MPRIPYRDFGHHAPDSVGEQVNVNHRECTAGLDTKRRLYVKRVHKNGTDIILAYCHHCGLSGTGVGDVRKIKRSGGVSDRSRIRHRSNVCLPYDVTRDQGSWSFSARSWIRLAGITEKEVEDYGFSYSEYYDRVIIPVYMGGTALTGWIGRRLSTDKEVPKYIYQGVQGGNYYLLRGTNDCTTLCIVEDILSCIKVHRYIDCLALCGTTINDTVLSLLSDYSKVIIFLDDDNTDVRKKQRLLKSKLELVIDEVLLVHSKGVDPKEMKEKELKSIIGM